MQKATRQQTKEHNTNLVLRTIYRQGDTSRADIARVTGLTRTTVSDLVAELLETGLLEETGIGSSLGGKPPILLSLKDNSRQLICLHLNSRQFAGAVVNLRGKICRQESVDLDGITGEAALQVVFDLVDRLCRSAEAPLIGVGIGIPGLIDPVKGVVRQSVYLKWADLPLKVLLEEQCRLPVHLLNVNHAAALAEYTFGASRQTPNLIVVRVGEGIGAGILLSGRIHSGDGFGAGEIGHLTVVEGGRQCTCGNYGCLETVASPQAILQRMKELAEYEWISFAAGAALKPEDITWDFVQRAFEEGDETVTELVKEAGRYLGISVANLVSILNVRTILLTGCYIDFGDPFLEAVRSEVKQKAMLAMAEETRISNSALESDPVILGASALVLSNEAGLP